MSDCVSIKYVVNAGQWSNEFSVSYSFQKSSRLCLVWWPKVNTSSRGQHCCYSKFVSMNRIPHEGRSTIGYDVFSVKLPEEEVTELAISSQEAVKVFELYQIVCN